MNEFEERMRRLKRVLGLTQDKDVAAALGMTKASLSDRKRRGSFPEDHVVALIAVHPDLDVQYVLTGRGAVDRRAQNSVLLAAQGAGKGPLRGELEAALQRHNELGARLEQLEKLLQLGERCDDKDLDLLLRLASRLGSSRPRRAAAAPPAPAAGTEVATDEHSVQGQSSDLAAVAVPKPSQKRVARRGPR